MQTPYADDDTRMPPMPRYSLWPSVSQAAAVCAGHLIEYATCYLASRTRALILEPNRHSSVKVERYTFGLEAMIKIGEAGSIEGKTAPDVNFRPNRAMTNVDAPGLVYLADARVANVSFITGGRVDAWQWSPLATDASLDLPTLTPANSAFFFGEYTGRKAPPQSAFAQEGDFRFILSFTGPASIVA